MENNVCKIKLILNAEMHLADIYALSQDINKINSLLEKLPYGTFLNPEVVHIPMILPGPLEFCKTQDFQFIFSLTNKEYQDGDLKLKFLGVIQETIWYGGEIYELLSKDNKFFTSKLLPESLYSSKVKAISEMERIEKLLKEVDLQLSPEQEVKLLRKIVEQQQTVINNLQGN